MNGKDMVTDFILRKDHWATPYGTFGYHNQAVEAYEANGVKRGDAVITHTIEMSKISDLLKALNKFCGKMAEEYDFTLSPSLRYGQPDALIPEKFWHLIAYAVEGGSEGYYVHVGAITANPGGGRDLPSLYIDFGFAKMNGSDAAYAMAKEAARFLAAAAWN